MAPERPAAALGDPNRLAAVHATGLLDTAPEEAFDRLTRLAATLLAVPSAFVTIVDDRRAFWKSCVGAAAEVGVRENPVEASFCQYVIADDEGLCVGDAAADPRTRDNPSVSLMGVAAYAGYPVRCPDGQVLGTLCVIDVRPRDWTARDREVLQTLADAASDEVALRIALAGSRQVTRLQAYLLALTDDLRPLSDPEEVQQAASRLLGEWIGASRVLYAEVLIEAGGAETWVVERNYAAPGVPPLLGRLDAAAFGPVLRARLHAGETVVVPDVGAADWLAPDVAAYRDAGIGSLAAVPLVEGGRMVAALAVHHGTPRGWSDEEVALLIGTAERTWAAVRRAHAESALRASEALYRLLFTSMEEAVVLCELVHDTDGAPVDWRWLEVNDSHAKIFQVREVVGRCAREVFPDIDRRWLVEFARTVADGQPRHFEVHSTRTGKWFDVQAMPMQPHGRFAAVTHDVTAHRLAEARERLRATFGDALAPVTDSGEVQEIAARLLGEYLGADGVCFGEVEPDGQHARIAHGHFPRSPDLRGRHRLDDYGSAIADRLRAGRPGLQADSAVDHQLTEAQRAAYAALGVRAFLAVPLMRGRLVAYAVAVCTGPRVWTAEDVSVAVEVTARTWAAVERTRAEAATARLAAEEHRIGLGLQRALLPARPMRHPAVEIAARYEAASEIQIVGGDWYDSFALPGGRLGLTVGDVVGHGLEAAAAMGTLRVAMAALAPHANGPGRLLSQLDAFAATLGGPGYATACFAAYDPGSRELRYATAGHPPILAVTPDGETRLLTAGRSGPLTGDVDHGRPEATEIIEPGALLMLYSDGLIERRQEPVTAGLARLAAATVAIRDLPLEQLCDRLLADLGVAERREDDVVVVCLRTQGPAT